MEVKAMDIGYIGLVSRIMALSIIPGKRSVIFRYLYLGSLFVGPQ